MACLGYPAFQLPLRFVGEDLIFSHIHEDQAGLAVIISLSFIIDGLAIIRTYARVFLGHTPSRCMKWRTGPLSLLIKLSPVLQQPAGSFGRVKCLTFTLSTKTSYPWPSQIFPVAYFCMEYGLHSDFKIYAGGLGIPAGDYLKGAKDRKYPIVGLGIKWKQGYTDQRINDKGR